MQTSFSSLKTASSFLDEKEKRISKLGDKAIVENDKCKSKRLNHVLVVSIVNFLLYYSTFCCLYLFAVEVIFIFLVQ